MLALKASGASAPASVWTADLSVLLAASAAQQAASPTAQRLASFLRGQDGKDDKVDVLAALFAAGTRGVIDTTCLAGSFNPVVARQQVVGQE